MKYIHIYLYIFIIVIINLYLRACGVTAFLKRHTCYFVTPTPLPSTSNSYCFLTSFFLRDLKSAPSRVAPCLPSACGPPKLIFGRSKTFHNSPQTT